MKSQILSTAMLAAVVSGSALSLNAQLKPSSNPVARPAAADRDSQALANTELVIRLTYVLNTISEDAKSWKDTAAAGKTQAKIADLLWDWEPESARTHLLQAWATTSKIEEAKERSRYRNESARTDARREVIFVARKRDKALATQWLDEMANEATNDKDSPSRGAFDDRTARSTVLLQMALQIADSDPQNAATLAIESLQDGVSFGFQQVLLKLQEKNFDVAQTVFRAALARLRSSGLADPNELIILYSYLYTPGTVIAPGADRGTLQLASGRDRPRVTATASQLNPALAAEFMNLAADLLLALPLPSSTADPETTARNQIGIINALLGGINGVSPQKAMALGARVAQLENDAHFSMAPLPLSPRPERRQGETNSDYLNRRVDAMVEAAEKESTSLGRDIGYAKAALATTVEVYERGLDIAHKIDDDTLRDGVSNWLIYRATLQLIGTRDYERAFKLNAKSTEPLQRAAVLVVASQAFLKTNKSDAERIRGWLEEASSLATKADPDIGRARVGFGIVAAYGQLDQATALRSLSDAVRWLNQIDTTFKDDDRAPLLKKFSGFANLSDFTYGTNGFSLSSALRAFGRDQFDEVLSIVNTISNRESRGSSALLFCEQTLRSIPPPKQRPVPAAAK